MKLEVTARDDIRIEPISPYKSVGRTATGRSYRSATSASEQSVAVVLRLSFPYGDLGREVGAIVSLCRSGRGVRARRDRARRAGPARPGPTPTTGPTTRSRATGASTTSSPGCSPHAPGRTRSPATAPVTSRRPRRQMAATAERIRSYADGDPDLLAAGRLAGRRDRRPSPRPMAEMSRKQRALREREHASEPRPSGPLHQAQLRPPKVRAGRPESLTPARRSSDSPAIRPEAFGSLTPGV